MVTAIDKTKAVIVATEWFKSIECVNVSLGLIESKADCPECSAAFITLIQDIINGTETLKEDSSA